MTPELSEFSYGFALTNELIDIGGPLSAAPIFPSLIEEGRAGGGYDVNLDIPGFPLFLQFKRSDCMVGMNSKEVASPYNFVPPFYRMKITERRRSAQHDMLLDLDDGHNAVFYAAPLFHTVAELNHAYITKSVSDRSFYIRPSDIGRLDDNAHHVAFDKVRRWVFSEPRETMGIRGTEFPETLMQRRLQDERPLRDGPLNEALVRAEKIVRDRDLPTGVDYSRVPDDAEVARLRRLGDLSLRYFGAQLFIIQDSESQEQPT